MNCLDEDEVVATVRLTIRVGIDQARKFRVKAQLDYQKVVAQKSSLKRTGEKA